MATAGDLIRKALKKARLIGVDQTASSAMIQNGLESLNQMLDAWWIERLAVPFELQENFALAAGNQTRTIGTGGNFNTTRPVKILSAFIRDGSSDYPVWVAESQEEYDSIPNKASTGRPTFLWYTASVPLGTISLYPVPDQAYTLFINTHKRIESFSNAADTADLAPAYERSIVANLAVDIAPDYGLEAPASVQKTAVTSKAVIKRLNAPNMTMSMPWNLPGLRARYNIHEG